MTDRIVRGTAANSEVRFFLTDCTETVKKAAKIHNLSVSNSYVLGKFICAGLLMSADLKSDKGVITISTDADGHSGRLVVTANSRSQIKAYISNPEHEPGELSFSTGDPIDRAVLGNGTITVIKDMGLKTPYSGQVEMKFGSVAKDITYYFVVSEQVPTSISLGVLMDDSGKIRKAGGFLIQLMPGHSDETVEKLENNILSFPNFTDILDMDYDLESIAEKMLLKGIDVLIHGEIVPEYRCACGRKKMRNAALMLREKEIKEMLEKEGFVEVHCHFCNRKYKFTEKDFI